MMNARACISVAVLLNGSLQVERTFQSPFPLFSAFPRYLWILQLPRSRLDVACVACSVCPAGPSIDALFLMQPFKLSIISNQQLCAVLSGRGMHAALLHEINKVYSLGFYAAAAHVPPPAIIQRAQWHDLCLICMHCPELGGCRGTILRGIYTSSRVMSVVAVIMYPNAQKSSVVTGRPVTTHVSLHASTAGSKFDVEGAPDCDAANASGLHRGAVLALSAPSATGKKWPVATAAPIRLMAQAVNKRARSASKRIPPPDAQVNSVLGASDQQPGTDIISLLQLQPHPEGGFYKRT